MCGITGWVAYRTDLRTRTAELERMTATMAARGPDDRGTWSREHVGLGHCRLAVIDLPGGTQPMTARTDDGEVALVYSGEVYDFAELRGELGRLGHRFDTRSDTEVVLRAYLEWGEDVADHLTGMFAFAVWDGRDERLHLVRDRLGVKPLYYLATPDGVLFGSEPKAILANPLAPAVVELEDLRELVGFTKAPGWALWKDMAELPPGTVATVDRGGLRQRSYWSLAARPHTDDPETTVATVRELLSGIVAQQGVADVPQCVLLSGGLDSSAVTALAARGAAERGERLRTFSVDFTGHEENFSPDELRSTPDAPFVRDVVAHTGTDHTDVLLDPGQLTDPELRRSVVRSRDMPIGLGDIDTSLHLLFGAIREHATVAVSGEGADELFGGYPWSHHEAARDAPTFPWLAFNSAYTTDRAAPLTPGLREALDVPGYLADQYAQAVAGVDALDGEDPVEARRRVSSHLHLTRLLQSMLDRKDRASMAVGLEVRVPFCDHRLVEYVHNVPWSMKTADGREKSLLRAAAGHVLPASVVQRVKSPYPSPQDPLFTARLQDQCRALLAGPDTPVLEVFDRDWLTVAVGTDPAAVSTSVRNGLDRVLDLHHWLDLHQPELRLC